ncbi:MAG: glycosyltransferase family 4 protein [Caulobacteraceae bacterium]|jgi:glycosyltransferase involved in cell wall biosynthesis
MTDVQGGAVIFVNRFFHPDHSATSQILSDLAFDLAGSGRRVVVITSRLRYDDPAARLPAREPVRGVEVRRVATTGFGRAGLAGRALDLLSFHASAALALLAVAQRGDVIVAKTDPPLISVVAGWAAALKGARLVNWLQDVYPEVAAALGVGGGAVAGVLTALRDASLRRARINVVLGRRMAERLTAAPKERVRIIANWVDETAITPVAPADNPLRRAWGLEDAFVVGYSGNLGRAHEHAAMLGAARALAHDPRIVFLMIGGGHQMEALRAEAPPNLRFQPYQDAADLSQSLSAPDVHWISLRPELEGLIVPSKAYGVLAAGRPILAVTAADGEIARLVAEHGCGLQCDPGDAEGFALAVRTLADDPDLVRRLGAAARRASETAFSRQVALAAWRAALAAAAGT